MPWKETCAMNERLGFVLEFERGEETLSELCRRFGISRKTGYKFLARYHAEGAEGVRDRSRAPHQRADAVDPEAAERVIGLRQRYPDWGPRKLIDWLERKAPELRLPSASTAARLLKQAGLVKPRGRKRRATPYGAPFVTAVEPNDLWCIDFKGQWRMGNGRLCYPLTLSDAASRYVLVCQGLSGPTHRSTVPHVERALREYGLPRAIRSDNGQPFGSCGLAGLTPLALWWLKLGIIPERIAPGCPQQNARHERMHNSLAKAITVGRGMKEQQEHLDRWLITFNTERQHEALGRHQTPSMHYRPSPRPYPSKLAEFSYPEDYEIRRVQPSGSIHWRGREWYLAALLRGEFVGLRPIEDGVWLVFVGQMAVGKLDARAKRVEPIRSALDIPTLH